jgi:hypothetical protein
MRWAAQQLLWLSYMGVKAGVAEIVQHSHAYGPAHNADGAGDGAMLHDSGGQHARKCTVGAATQSTNPRSHT